VRFSTPKEAQTEEQPEEDDIDQKRDNVRKEAAGTQLKAPKNEAWGKRATPGKKAGLEEPLRQARKPKHGSPPALQEKNKNGRGELRWGCERKEKRKATLQLITWEKGPCKTSWTPFKKKKKTQDRNKTMRKKSVRLAEKSQKKRTQCWEGASRNTKEKS